jgi:hypothetical protein
MPLGIYERTEEMNKTNSESKIRYYKNHKHPREGIQHTKESCYKISEATKGKNNPMFGRHHKKESIKQMSESAIKNLKKGMHFKTKFSFFRKDLEHYCRSKFEANYCRILKYRDIKYIYETKKNVFKLSNGMHYVCDLYLPKTNEYIELKGYIWPQDKKKIKMFLKEYPNIKWKIIMQHSEEWKKLKEEYKYKIKYWED